MDITKLKIAQDKFNQESVREIYDEIPESFIQFSNSKVINYCLHQVKEKAKQERSSRVLNSWIEHNVIAINDEDKGKIRRFDRLESIWLGIVVEARKFGIPLDSLKQTRRDLTQSPVKNFSLLKFSILDTILRKPKVLMILEDGFTNVVSFETYTKWISKGLFPTHINFKLMDFISLEYPNNAFGIDFKLSNPYEDKNKMTLLYFLKTGDYKYIKLHLDKGDVRLIEDSNVLAQNEELMKIISDWDFLKAEIIINDEVIEIITL